MREGGNYGLTRQTPVQPYRLELWCGYLAMIILPLKQMTILPYHTQRPISLEK